MPPTFHYCPEPKPAFTYTDTIDNVLYTCRVTHSDRELYFDDTFTRPGELTPSFIHTTTTVSSDGLVNTWSEESTHRYQKSLGTFHHPPYHKPESSPPTTSHDQY